MLLCVRLLRKTYWLFFFWRERENVIFLLLIMVNEQTVHLICDTAIDDGSRQ